MRKVLLGIVVGLTFAGAARADEWVVEAHFQDQSALQRAARHFQHVIIDRSRNVLRVEANDAGIEALEAEGLVVTIDEVATAKLRRFSEQVSAAAAGGRAIDSIPGYECFRTVEETYQTMDGLAAAHPDIAQIDDIGPTWKRTQNPDQGYEMRAMHITNFATAAADPDRPRMAVFSSIHAREYAPAEVDTRFAEWLVDNYGTDPEATWLVDHNDFHLILQANPDGRKHAEQQVYWRKNVDQIDGNCDGNPNVDTDGDGIDLNRNFPFHWNITHGGGSDGNVCGETYRGPLAASEPETQNLMQYVAGTCDDSGNCVGGLFGDRRDGPMDPPNVGGDGGAAAPDDTSGFFVDIHSNAAMILWPWGDTATDAPNGAELQTLGRRIAWFNGYLPQQSDELYPTDGTTDDTMYGLLGVASYTIETNGFDFFEDCASFEGNTAPTNLAALRYISRSLHAPYLLPAGPDTIDVSALPNLVVAGDPLDIEAHLDSSRFNNSNGSQPVHDIASALAFIDALPWDGTDPGTAISANDGAFDSSAETAVGTLATDGLASGRHFVYVQATDDTGNAGTPNAAFFDVGTADQIGTLTGRVTDAASGDALAATIDLHDAGTGESRRTTSDAGTGDYTARAFAGTFDVSVSAPRHLTQSLAGLALAGGTTVTQDFSLLHDCEIFSDDVESGGSLWTAQSPWVIGSNVGGNATHVWNTPNYGDNIDRSLTTAAAYDLTGYGDATVDFDDRCDTESGYDYGYLEYSTNGSSWNTIYSCTGQSSWQSHHVALPSDADGAVALRLRFRLQSDTFQNAPGWAIDNIRLAAGGEACIAQQQNDEIFADGFEP